MSYPPRIMYIEHKGGALQGPARIGRVCFSKSGATLYYGGRTLESLKGGGYKANYIDVDNRDYYWISGCKKDGTDRLYPGIVEIDDDIREEYWLEIRNRPDLVKQSRFRCDGKYNHRAPR